MIILEVASTFSSTPQVAALRWPEGGRKEGQREGMRTKVRNRELAAAAEAAPTSPRDPSHDGEAEVRRAKEGFAGAQGQTSADGGEDNNKYLD